MMFTHMFILYNHQLNRLFTYDYVYQSQVVTSVGVALVAKHVIETSLHRLMLYMYVSEKDVELMCVAREI